MTVVIKVRLARPRRRPLTPAQVARVRALQVRIDREVAAALAAKGEQRGPSRCCYCKGSR